jgi:hypothetical protein
MLLLTEHDLVSLFAEYAWLRMLHVTILQLTWCLGISNCEIIRAVVNMNIRQNP